MSGLVVIGPRFDRTPQIVIKRGRRVIATASWGGPLGAVNLQIEAGETLSREEVKHVSRVCTRRMRSKVHTR